MSIASQSPRAIVQEGYDTIAARYCTWAQTVRVAERERYTTALLDALPAGAAVLELGCGAGVPTTQRLAERFTVTGVDLSRTQIALARQSVPSAQFIQNDMTAMQFPPGSFDAVCAFYSITHVPREQHAALLRSIASWLRSGGMFVASFSSRGSVDTVEDDWLGAPMFFSGYDVDENRRLVRDAGLTIESDRIETDSEFGRPAAFLWIVATKR